ncbi:MAG: hypothetical protein GC160_17235 [Acidobacteria bacterium]|nr:hypothetical protein [Acidobacteriota bacterium]
MGSRQRRALALRVGPDPASAWADAHTLWIDRESGLWSRWDVRLGAGGKVVAPGAVYSVERARTDDGLWMNSVEDLAYQLVRPFKGSRKAVGIHERRLNGNFHRFYQIETAIQYQTDALAR